MPRPQKDCLATMVSLRSPTEPTRFPSDPRFEVDINPSAIDIENLKKDEFLSSNLLDCLLNRTLHSLQSSIVCGSFLTQTILQNYVEEAATIKGEITRKMARMSRKIQQFKCDKSSIHFVIPGNVNHHWFITEFVFNASSKDNLVVTARVYDSLKSRVNSRCGCENNLKVCVNF